MSATQSGTDAAVGGGGGAIATPPLPPALVEHNKEQRPLLNVIAGVLEALKRRAAEEAWASGWCRGLHLMEPFFDAFQSVFEEVLLVQAGMDPHHAEDFTSGMGNLDGGAAWTEAAEEWRSSEGAGWRNIALSVHQHLSMAAEVGADLAPIMAATRAIALDDYEGLAAKYVTFVDIMAGHVAAFLKRTQAIDVLELASEVSMMRSGGAPSVYDEGPHDETGVSSNGAGGVVPHNGVTLFVMETLGRHAPAASGFSTFFVSGLQCTEHGGTDDVAQVATESTEEGSPIHGLRDATAGTPEESDLTSEQQEILRRVVDAGWCGSWKRDLPPGEDATAHTLAMYHHLGVGAKIGAAFAAKILAYITETNTITSFLKPSRSRGRSAPGRLHMRFNFRSIGLLGKHSLFTADYDLTRQNTAPVLQGQILTRYWFHFPSSVPSGTL